MDASPLPIVSAWSAEASAKPSPPPGLVALAGVAGSAAQALQRAQHDAPGRDVLLLRADAELGESAWRRLLAAWQAGDWQVLSPLDGRWPGFAGDDGDGASRDARCWALADHAAHATGDWSPLCSLWRAAAVATGQADRIGLLPCVYVGPAQPALDLPDPPALGLLRRRWQPAGRTHADADVSRPVVLHVLHAWGGGAERFVRDLGAADRERRHLVLVARGDDDRPPYGRRLALHDDLDAPPLQVWPLAEPIADSSDRHPQVQALLQQLRDEWGVGAVLVSSLVGHSLEVFRTSLPTAWCVHDAYPLWPLLHDCRDPRESPFDAAALARGLAEAGTGFVFANRDAGAWWRLRESLLATLAANHTQLVAPSRSARERLCALAPELARLPWHEVPHGLALAPATALPEAPRSRTAPLRVLVPGHLHGAKGEVLLAPVIAALPENIELVLLGGGHAAERFLGRRNVHVLKGYRHDELADWVARLSPDLALLPSTVPETWSYVLSEMLALGVPVLCADRGAYAERLAAGGGWTVPAQAGAVLARLRALAADRSELVAMHAAPAPPLPSMDDMVRGWREALPAEPPRLRLAPATAERVAALAEQAQQIGGEAQQHSLAARLAEQQAELDRRADWASQLDAERQRALQALERLQGELLPLRGQVAALQAGAAAQGASSDAALAALAERHQGELDALGRRIEAERQAREQSHRQQLEALAQAQQAKAEAARQAAELAAASLQQRIDQLQAQLAEYGARLSDSTHRHAEALATQAQQHRQQLADAEGRLQEMRDQLAAAEAARAGEQAAATDLAATLARLRHELEESHRYYQQDTADLARQRDVALAQRNQLEDRLQRLLRHPVWRLATPLRWLVDRLRRLVSNLQYRWLLWRGTAARAWRSLRTRGWHGTWQRLRERRATRPVPAELQLQDEAGALDPASLRLPCPDHPRASIVIPAYGQLPYTLACLRALMDCGDRAAFEVIVVDDASKDDSGRVLAGVAGLRYHRNAENLGFIGACNAGAALARGDFLVFLNNDTAVQPGWLDALLATFAQHPDTGLAGSKLVYPDGRLQEAGGIVFSDASGWNYGRFDDPAHPRYNYVREADYCSGAAIALPRALFSQLGGFDALYAPAYYEDTDLAMRVRAHGLKVRYQPASVVVHYEGITSGTDLSQGTKAYQVRNQQKFLERWRETLRTGHPAPGTDIRLAAEHRARQRILVLDACTPTPDRDSGSVRMAALMRLLVDEGCALSFFPENHAHDGAYTEALQQLGVAAWWQPWLGSVPRWLEENGPRFDLVIASRHYVLAPLLPMLRHCAPQARIVFDTVDLHYLRERREAELAGDPARARAAERTRDSELDLISRVDATWVVSEAEQALLAQERPQARVEVLSNIHAVRGAGPGVGERAGLLFVGGYRHPPNVDAALWLADEILPLVRAELPEVELHLVGGDAPEAIARLGERPGIRFHGYVPDLLPLLDGTRIALAPLRYGAGVKGKVNHSLAHGQPVVATTCAVEGMHLVDGEDVLIADDAAAFAAAVRRLYGDAALWQRLSAGGLENTRRHFSADAARPVLRRLLNGLPRRQ